MTKHTTEKVKVQAIPKIDIPHYATVDMLRLGDRHMEVLYMKSKPVATIKKLSKDTYQVISTGQVKQYDHTQEGKQVELIKKAMKRLERIIKANFDTVGNKENALFVTLTYAELQFDTVQLLKDFESFYKRLKRARKNHAFENIVIAEPHGSGAWHLHMLIKSDQKKLFIANDEMEKLWRHGFTKTVRLQSDDVGCYYTAYFSNSDASDPEDPEDQDGEYAYSEDEDGRRKKYKKGDRLRFYPKHMKFYRCSRGIIRPKPEAVKYAEVPKDLGEPRKITTYAISKQYKKYDKDEVAQVLRDYQLNTIQTEIYKKPPQIPPRRKKPKNRE